MSNTKKVRTITANTNVNSLTVGEQYNLKTRKQNHKYNMQFNVPVKLEMILADGLLVFKDIWDNTFYLYDANINLLSCSGNKKYVRGRYEGHKAGAIHHSGEATFNPRSKNKIKFNIDVYLGDGDGDDSLEEAKEIAVKDLLEELESCTSDYTEDVKYYEKKLKDKQKELDKHLAEIEAIKEAAKAS